jgi:uncharacterized membrane protein YjfL (UPF0719 family)
MNQLLLSLLQLAVAILLSAIAAFVTFYLWQLLTRGLDEWEALRAGNPAVGLVLGAILVSVAIVLRPALSLSTANWDAGTGLFYKGLLAEVVQLAVGLVAAIITIALALGIFTWLTGDIDELAELKKGNLAIAGLLAGVVIAVGLMVSQAAAQIMGVVSSLLF